jgi:diaminopimelate decarboxylase
MASFAYKNHILGVETQNGWRDLSEITKTQKGPFYLYSRHSIEERAQILSQNLKGLDFKVHYAVKANGNAEVLKILKNQGCGVDVVSRGEAQWSLDNGFAPEEVIFSGVAKSKEDLRFAVDLELYQINVESLPELSRLGEVATALKKKARVGIRINPNIKVDTHPYITTGFRENKFGIAEYQIKEALEIIGKFAPYLELRGLSSHIGSQIRELSPLSDAVQSFCAQRDLCFKKAMRFLPSISVAALASTTARTMNLSNSS